MTASFLTTLRRIGRPIFSVAIVAIGIETLACAAVVGDQFGANYSVNPVIPWLPAIPALTVTFGIVFVACGLGLLFRSTARTAALVLGAIFFLSAFLLEIPKQTNIMSPHWRTVVFEPLALAALAWIVPGKNVVPPSLYRTSLVLLGIALLVFSIAHFQIIAFIASLIPAWLPWHAFWVVFFGLVFVASGLSIITGILRPWGAAGLGLMYAIWVLTLHLPDSLGLYGPHMNMNADHWQSLFIATALWGGAWALADE